MHAWDFSPILSPLHPPNNLTFVSPIFPDLHKRPFPGPTIVFVISPAVGLLYSMMQMMINWGVALHSYWFTLLCEWASGNWQFSCISILFSNINLSFQQVDCWSEILWMFLRDRFGVDMTHWWFHG
jgi:hypothetical protein